MLKIRVIPCLLLDGNGLVKTVKFKNPTYIGDPINAVKIFNDKFVDEIIFLDISKNRFDRGPNFQLIEQIASESFIPFCYGGGIRSVEDASKLFSLGVEKISICTQAFYSAALVKECVAKFGSQSITISIDVKKTWFGGHKAMVKNGRKDVGQEIVDFAKKMESYGVGEILINSVDLDGTMKGYDIELLTRIAAAVSVPVIACGGAGSLNDMKEIVKKADVSAVAAGSLFVFKGKHKAVLINYPSYQKLKDLFSGRYK